MFSYYKKYDVSICLSQRTLGQHDAILVKLSIVRYCTCISLNSICASYVFLILESLSFLFVLFSFFFFTLWPWSSDQYKMHSADHVHNADTVDMNYRPKQFLNYFSATLHNSNTKLTLRHSIVFFIQELYA